MEKDILFKIDKISGSIGKLVAISNSLLEVIEQNKNLKKQNIELIEKIDLITSITKDFYNKNYEELKQREGWGTTKPA